MLQEEDRAEKAEEAAKLFLSISDTLKNQGTAPLCRVGTTTYHVIFIQR